LLTIAPEWLKVLSEETGELPRKLDPATSEEMDISEIDMTKALFDEMHAADRMATDKLAEGIEGFSKSLVELEELLAGRLRAL
jgi:transaldolase